MSREFYRCVKGSRGWEIALDVIGWLGFGYFLINMIVVAKYMHDLTICAILLFVASGWMLLFTVVSIIARPKYQGTLFLDNKMAVIDPRKAVLKGVDFYSKKYRITVGNATGFKDIRTLPVYVNDQLVVSENVLNEVLLQKIIDEVEATEEKKEPQVVASAPAPVAQVTLQAAAEVESANSVAEELRNFKQLLDEGIITQEEYDAKKKQLLGL